MAERTGEQMSAVQVVADAHGKAIRQRPAELVSAELVATIVSVATEYGARRDVAPNVLRECVALVMAKFNHLAVAEIREAYRQWTAGEVKVDGKGEMWGGEFNAMQIGAVLKAYADRRRAIHAELLRQVEAIAQAEAEKRRQEAQKAEFEKNFFKTLDKLRASAKSWQDVPEYLYQTLRNKGILKLTSLEGVEIMEQAEELAKIEAQQPKKNNYQFALKTEFEPRAKVIARKLAVYQKVIQPFQISTT